MDRIIILGAGVMQGPAIRIAGELGLERFVLDGNADAVHRGGGEHFFQIDLKDAQGILALAARLKGETAGRLGIITAGTDFSAPAAYVAQKLGLPGHRYEAALNASDKERMRGCFQKAGVPSPAFAVVRPAARDMAKAARPAPALPKTEALSLLARRFPLVVKPCDNMGGRGCSRADNADELAAAIADAARFSRTGRAIVEEYMDGPEFSVDALVHDGQIRECGFAARHIFFPPYFVEMGHTMPAALDGKDKRRLMECFEAGVRALGLTEGAAKGDLKLTGTGPMIGEIAARLSGGYMSGWTFPYSSGFEVTKAAIEIAMGREPVIPDAFNALVSAERAVISIPGRVRAVSGIEEARRRPGIRNVFMRVADGAAVVFPRNNVEKCGNVISVAAAREEAVRAAEEAARSILIRLEPHNRETDAFLAMPCDTAFPPSAFGRGGDGVPRDYAGRTREEALAVVRAMTGRDLPPGTEAETALMRGGYQGAVYHIDSMR